MSVRWTEPWRLTLSCLLGGLAALVLMVISYDPQGWVGFGPSGEGEWTPVGAAVAVGAAIALRRQPDRRAWSWSFAGVATALAIVLGPFVAFMPLVVVLVLALAYMQVPPQVHLLGIVAMVPLFAMVCQLALPPDFGGMAFLVMGLSYFLIWALRDRVAWGRRTAWGLAAALAVGGLAVSLSDLFVYIDAVGVASAILASLVLVGVTLAWLVSRPRTTALA